MMTETRISDVELRMSEHLWEILPEFEREHVKEVVQEYAHQAGHDKFFEYIWCRMTLENYFMFELAAPAVSRYFKAIEE
jgi:hypothetical protein